MNLKPVMNFLESTLDRCWVKCEGYSMYLRKSNRMIQFDTMGRAFDLASIEMTDPKKAGQGKFRKFLPEMIAALDGRGYEIIYVENVLNPRFEKFLLGQGFVYVKNTFPPCYSWNLVAKPMQAQIEFSAADK